MVKQMLLNRQKREETIARNWKVVIDLGREVKEQHLHLTYYHCGDPWLLHWWPLDQAVAAMGSFLCESGAGRSCKRAFHAQWIYSGQIRVQKREKKVNSHMHSAKRPYLHHFLYAISWMMSEGPIARLRCQGNVFVVEGRQLRGFALSVTMLMNSSASSGHLWHNV